MVWSKVILAFTLLGTMSLLKNYVQGGDPTSNASEAPSAENTERTVIEVKDDNEFDERMENHCGKLVVVDYTASWCGPCQIIAPYYATLPDKHPGAIFLKVDINKCKGAAEKHTIQSIPRFISYRNGVKVDEVVGADKTKLNTMLQKQMAYHENGGLNLVAEFIDKSQSECVNCNDQGNEKFMAFLENANSYLESDPAGDPTDPRLLMSITFAQTVRLHSLKIKAPESNGPKTIKLYVNLTNTLDVDNVTDDNPKAKQTIKLKPADLKGEPIPLMCSRFQQVQKLQILIVSNQSAPELVPTRIDDLSIIGSLVE